MSIFGSVKERYRRTVDFFGRQIWDQRLEELSTRRVWAYQTARIAYCTVKGAVLGDSIQVRAAALTYFTVLSLVPLLAFAFALLKGFGAYDLLIEETIRPYVLRFLSGNEALSTAFEQILGFVEGTGVTSLGFIGLLTLLYAATRLLRNIEGALNELWSVSTGREALQQLRDYVAIIVVTPLCLMAAVGLTATTQALELFRAAGETLGISNLLEQVMGFFGPLVVIFLGLLFLYKVMPYTNVRFVSAVAGAAIGALLWYAVLLVHVRFQVGVARYNALYSSFGAIPIFLAWLQVSWLVVLIGAQIASTHQNSRSIAQRRRIANFDGAEREVLGLSAVLQIAHAFQACQGAKSQRELSDAIGLPEPLVGELMERLVKADILTRSGEPSDRRYVLIRPPERVRVKDVLGALRETHDVASRPLYLEVPFGDLAVQTWQTLDRALERVPENRDLSQLLDGGAERGASERSENRSGERRTDAAE